MSDFDNGWGASPEEIKEQYKQLVEQQEMKAQDKRRELINMLESLDDDSLNLLSDTFFIASQQAWYASYIKGMIDTISTNRAYDFNSLAENLTEHE